MPASSRSVWTDAESYSRSELWSGSCESYWPTDAELPENSSPVPPVLTTPNYKASPRHQVFVLQGMSGCVCTHHLHTSLHHLYSQHLITKHHLVTRCLLQGMSGCVCTHHLHTSLHHLYSQHLITKHHLVTRCLLQGMGGCLCSGLNVTGTALVWQ